MGLTQIDPNTGRTGYGFVFVIPVNSGLADVTGTALYEMNGNNPAVLFNGTSDRTFTNILGEEATADPRNFSVTFTDPLNRPSNYLLPIYSFEQVGEVPGGVEAGPDVNGGRGAVIAVVVVRAGEGFVGGVTIQRTSGPSQRLGFVSPEPTGTAILGLSIGHLALRRRRAAAW